ncbi:response regulator [Lutibacter sp. A64]|uniref:hybrid sensor histidine kinase/response regulator transcription factor n=1 Tax=Lutibacter sp. A64 TaxID=2918526 RepID=UPI001F05ED82|nr:hybrid sensor histidine kinase/response regulator transcription factor [Lutibacter sp. A64]UMB54187.1 response regulator [Lutibacter sp. A64]
MKINLFLLVIILVIISSCGEKKESFPFVKNTESLETNNDNLKSTSNNGDEKYFIEQLDNTIGLSNSSINTIFQDSDDLLWIGTWDGLNRYDGTSFKIFRPELNNENSLSNQVILKIGQDSIGNLWIVTMGGINSYNKNENSFQRYEFSNKNEFTLSENEFNMAIDTSKVVYCSVKGWGLGYFNGNKFKKIINKNIPELAAKEMIFLNSGELLILYENDELYSITFESNKLDEEIISKTKVIAKNIKTFKKYTKQIAYLITIENKVLTYNGQNDKINKVENFKATNIIGNTSSDLILSNNATYTSISSSGEFSSKSYFSNFEKYKITTIVQGIDNVIWVGTDGDGLIKMYPFRKAFNLVSIDKVPEFEGGIVRSFAETDDGDLFVGTKGKGLFQFKSTFSNEIEEKLTYNIYDEENSEINNAVFSLYNGSNKLIFIGTDGEGLSIFDEENSKLTNWKNISNAKDYPLFKSIYAIYQDSDDYIWLGTNGYGLIRLKIKRKQNRFYISDFKNYVAGGGGNKALSSNIIFSIISKNEQELWIGTRLGGLNLFDKKQETFTIFKNDKENINSLSNNDILSLYNDEYNKLWIGTSFGLNVLDSYNKNEAVFKNFTVNDGLPNNTIHGIIGGYNETLWLSTSFGISTFDTVKNKFVNFTNQEGLQNNEFSDGSYYESKFTNSAFMGGIKGFNYFSLEKINESNKIPSLLINKISGQNQEKPYYQNLVITPNSKIAPKIILDHNQNFIDIELAALTYINSEKCKYAYKLDNFDKEWNEIDNRRIISFTNIPNGSFSLWVKWSNSDGIWSNPVHAIDIRIKPVFWQSNVAFIIYAVLFSLFILFVWSYYKKQNSLRQNIIFRKRDEKIHQNRLTFFTNIAHEFQTPLTLIVGPVQKLTESVNLDEKNQKFINMIQRNSSRLLFLTQQLLEFRKAEYDHLGVSVKQFDLVNLIEQIAELFDEWALDKNIEFNAEFPSGLIGWFDKDKIEKIIFNLLSNAFKYTLPKGKIKLQFGFVDTNNNLLYIKVSNSGKGISKEKLNSLFDRFFLADGGEKADTDLFRTGIGLAYIKRLVTVLKGEIEVSSKANKFTTFTIILPCSKESFNEKELDLEGSQVLISHHLKNILNDIENKQENTPNKMSSIEELLDKRKVILIVEDEREIQLFLDELLRENYKIVTASNGLIALEIMKKMIPDLIITDVMMPEMDGIELCKRTKSDNKTCHIPVIMLTAKSSISHRIEGLESGANSYIPKPFYPDHILIRVQKLLEERELILKHLSQDTFVENLTSLPVDNDEKELLRKVIELIRNNIENEKLQSSFIEEKLGISSSQLYRKIKQIFGFSPGDLIRTIRLKHAAELLRKSNFTVSEVCYQSGFNNRSYFYREFKKVYDSTPKNYQLKFKQSN